IALLSAGWLFGLGYYHQPDWLTFSACIVIGTMLLGGIIRAPHWNQAWIAALLLIPGAWIAPWPYKVSILLMIIGLPAASAPSAARSARWIGSGMLLSGLVLLAQALSMHVYEFWTARSHDLPQPLPDLLAALARLLDIDAAASG